MSCSLSSFTSFLSTKALPTSPTAQNCDLQPESSPKKTSAGSLLSNPLIKDLAARALKFPAPRSDSPTYYPPLPDSRFGTAGSAHFLYNGQNKFLALIPVRPLKDEMFRSVQEGILYDSTTQKTTRVAIRALHSDKIHLREKLDHSHVVHRKFAEAIKRKPPQTVTLITEPSTPFGNVWTSPLPLCNLLEATQGKLSNGTPLTPRQLLKLVQHVAHTLKYFHERDWVHGEVTPENMVLMSTSEEDQDALPKAHLQGFDFCVPNGYSDVGLALEDPCSHFSIAMPLTDIYGMASALAIFFSTSERPITVAFLEEECTKHIQEFLKTGSIANLGALPKYPFEKAIKLICYEQMSLIAYIFQKQSESIPFYNVPSHFLKEKQLPHGHRTWELKPQSIEEAQEIYHYYRHFFTKQTIQQAEKAITEKFKAEGIPQIRLSDLLKAAEALVKKEEDKKLANAEVQTLLSPAQEQQNVKNKYPATTSAFTPREKAFLEELSEREIRESSQPLFPAQYHVDQVKPSTTSQNQRLPSTSAAASSTASKVPDVLTLSVRTQPRNLEQESTTSTDPLGRMRLSQRNPLVEASEVSPRVRTSSNTRNSSPSEKNESLLHQGSPLRTRRETTSASANRQQTQSILPNSTYGNFIRTSASLGSSGASSSLLRSNTPASSAVIRQLPQSGLTHSSTHGLIRK